MTTIPIVIGVIGTVPKGWGKRTERVGNRWTNRYNPDYSIVKIVSKTQKSLIDLRRLTVAKTPVKYNQLTLVRRTCRSYIVLILSEEKL